MKTPEDARDWAARRIKHFAAELEVATDPLVIEAKIYTIMRTAEQAYKDVRGMITLSRSEK